MRREQTNTGLLLRLEQRRAAAASLLATITKEREVRSFTIPGFIHGSAISRGKHGENNKVFGAVVLLEAMAQAGCTRQEMTTVVAHLLAVIEELRPASEIDVDRAVIAEQASDSSEDFAQVQALIDPSRTARWVEAMEVHVGDVLTAIAAVRARMRKAIRRAA